MAQIRIPGRPHSIVIDFPFETGLLFSASLIDETDRVVQRWEKPIPKNIMKQYGHLMPAAKFFIKLITESK